MPRRVRGSAARDVGEPAERGQHGHRGVPLREGEGDDHGDQGADHPDQLLAHAEPRERTPLRGQGYVALRHGVERGLGHRAAQADHEGEHHLGQERAPDGTPGRRGCDEPEGAQQQLLLGHVLAEPSHQDEPDDGPDAAAGQDEAVPVQPDALHAAKPERQHEGHEAGEPAHDAHGGQPEHHLRVGDRLQAHQVLLTSVRLAGLAVLAHPGRLVGPQVFGRLAPVSTGSRAPAIAAPTNTIVARTSTAGEPPSL